MRSAWFGLLVIVGCGTELTPAAQQVRQISTVTTDGCEFLGPVSASEYFGISAAGNTGSAMNKARNDVATRGGNAFVLTNTSSGEEGTIVQVDAYRCP